MLCSEQTRMLERVWVMCVLCGVIYRYVLESDINSRWCHCCYIPIDCLTRINECLCFISSSHRTDDTVCIKVVQLCFQHHVLDLKAILC
jgi:hypothetical protein